MQYTHEHLEIQKTLKRFIADPDGLPIELVGPVPGA